MTAELRFSGGHTGRVRCSMWSSDLLQLSAKVVDDRGQLRVLSPVGPFRRLSLRSADGNRVERFSAAQPSHINLTLSPLRCCAANR
jgi:hypothetical protein